MRKRKEEKPMRSSHQNEKIGRFGGLAVKLTLVKPASINSTTGTLKD